jgi:starvation-inducible DNA-binding protein
MTTQLSNQNKKAIASGLNRLLATEFGLYTKTLNFHWNVVGKWFGPLHKLFNDQYESLQEIVDLIAERVRALDHNAVATMTEYLQIMSIEENPNIYPDDTTMLKQLAHDHEIVIGLLRTITKLAETDHDAGTANMTAELLETHEKMLWMIKSHLL